MLSGLTTFLSETWPFLGALALVGIITYGALMPAIRAERRRQDRLESTDD